MEDLTGSTLGDYQLLRLLGRGAMAAVYLAEQQSLARRVAVKVLNADLARDKTHVNRFAHEARAAASLVHAHIVQVYEVGVSGDRHYLAQEYVPGGTLGQLVERSGALSPESVVGVMRQVADALSAAAASGLVHRDIKPENLMVDRAGVVKVADFGLARLSESATPRMTREGITLGTPLYMSPEQIEGRELDSRSDLYSLGVTAFHLLSGAPPFDGETALAVAVRHLNEDPPPLDERCAGVPSELAGIVHRLMAKSPDQRYASPSELLGALDELAEQGAAAGWLEAQRLSAGSSGKVSRRPSTSEETRELAQALRAVASKGQSGGQSGGRPGTLIKLLVGVACGALIGWALRPGALLPNRASESVLRESTVTAQLYRAKRVGTPEAWRAVEAYFPEAAEYHLLLAQRGYVIDCFNRGEHRQALSALERLANRAVDHPGIEAFAHAGLVIAKARAGDEAGAREALARLKIEDTPEVLRPTLDRTLTRLNAE